MRSNYWTIGAFADWLRGTPSLKFGTSSQWRDWKHAARTKHPIRFWLAEEGLRYLQNFVMWPADKLNDIRYHIVNRWVSRTHSLTAHRNDIRPGTWCDLGSRFLPCLFNELVDFVEVETAWHHVVWSEEAQAKYQVPWTRKGWLRWRTWRSAEAGVAHLEWAASLTNTFGKPGSKDFGKPTGQAIAAQEILDLYHWWKEDRPNRVSPSDASGWSDICERRRQNSDEDDFLGLAEDKTPAEERETRKALKEMRKIEAQYEKEDEQMMIRLIKIRNHLWT